MTKIPIILIVETEIETQKREILFDNVLQNYFNEHASGDIMLTMPEFQSINEKRVFAGFKMDILIYDLDKGINCIKRALRNLDKYSYEIKLRNEDNEWVLYESAKS
jgi:hypothetical protein